MILRLEERASNNKSLEVGKLQHQRTRELGRLPQVIIAADAEYSSLHPASCVGVISCHPLRIPRIFAETLT